MKRFHYFALALCSGAMVFQIAAWQPSMAAEPAPFELIRSLQALEDQIALGNAAAQATQPKMIAHIAERFAASDAKVWHDRKNIRAAILYLFSGGQPLALQDIIENGTFDKTDDAMLKGALAYAEGRDAEARNLLIDINPLAIPSNVGGHLALIQATLLGDEDIPRALKLLDIARLLVPGTLVEEAALRKEIFMIGDNGDLDKFTLLSRQYMHRFGKAIYADNFRQRFAAMVTQIGLSNDMTHVARLDKILNDLPAEEQTKLYLSIAQTAIVQGRTEVARYAAEKAAKLSANRRADAARASLYLGAAMIVTDSYDKGLATLNNIDITHLSKRDEDLRDAALNVAKVIRSRAPGGDDPIMWGLGSTEGGKTNEMKAWPVMDHAEKALADTDALLSRQAP